MLNWISRLNSRVAAGVLAAAVCGGGCNIEGGTEPTGKTSSLTWIVEDGCRDGRGLRVRFHDRGNNIVWPGSSEVYVVPSGDTRQATLTCNTSAQVCYGARTDPAGSTYWGVDLDGSKNCENCCTSCKSTDIRRELTCD